LYDIIRLPFILAIIFYYFSANIKDHLPNLEIKKN